VILVVVAAGCGGRHRAERPATTAAVAPAARTTSVPGPSPRLDFRSPRRDGYRFAARPVVVEQHANEFSLYVHMNRRLPEGVGGSVNGAFGGFGLRSTTYGHDPRHCYVEDMDIKRDATVPARSVRPGQLVTVRVYLGRGRPPLRVRVPLTPRALHQDDAPDPANLYLSLIGCARDSGP
jgi:hypothetical protein